MPAKLLAWYRAVLTEAEVLHDALDSKFSDEETATRVSEIFREAWPGLAEPVPGAVADCEDPGECSELSD